MQENTYAARLDRLLVQYVFRSQERVLEGGVVTQKSGTQDSSVDVTPVTAVIKGDDIARQGFYLTSSDDAIWGAGKENVPLPVKPGSNQRIDLLGIQIRDSQALGAGTDDDAVWSVVSGTTAPSNPPVPATPASFIPVARILRSASEGGVLNAAITDVAVRAAYPYGYGDDAPTMTGAPGDLFVEY